MKFFPGRYGDLGQSVHLKNKKTGENVSRSRDVICQPSNLMSAFSVDAGKVYFLSQKL